MGGTGLLGRLRCLNDRTEGNTDHNPRTLPPGSLNDFLSMMAARKAVDIHHGMAIDDFAAANEEFARTISPGRPLPEHIPQSRLPRPPHSYPYLPSLRPPTPADLS
jgi:hypothetical protein